MLDGPPEELKRPSESEQEPCNGKKPRTEDPLVAADVLACFAGPGSEDEHDSSNTTDAAPSSEKKQPAKQDEAPEGSVHNDDDDTETTVSCASDSVVGTRPVCNLRFKSRLRSAVQCCRAATSLHH